MAPGQHRRKKIAKKTTDGKERKNEFKKKPSKKGHGTRGVKKCHVGGSRNRKDLGGCLHEKKKKAWTSGTGIT